MIADVSALSQSSHPSEFVQVANTKYFVADDGVHGEALWKSDGTSAGTSLVADVAHETAYLGNVALTSLTNVNGTLFFVESEEDFSDMQGRTTYGSLYRSNGTTAGTVKIAFMGADEDPIAPFDAQLWNVNGALYYSRVDADTFTQDLWLTNGTNAGSAVRREFWPNNVPGAITAFTAVGGTSYFVADDGTHGRELWKTNGTSAGTLMIRDLLPGAKGSSPSNLTNVNGTLYFTANDGAHGTELWKTNGTSAGTALVRDIHPGTGASFLAAGPNDGSILINLNGTLYFNADDGAHGQELWKSNGTSVGTTLVRDVNPGTHYDGTKKTTVANISNPVQFTNVNGALFFSAYDATHGRELWRTDGTSAGTVLVRDIHPGIHTSSPGELTNAAGRLVFVADDGTHGAELWFSNGASTGTLLIGDVHPGSPGSSITGLKSVTGGVMFAADDGIHGSEPWIYSTINSAPLLDVTKSPALNSVAANSGNPVGKVGTLIDGLVHLSGSLKNVSDANAGAATGIAITAVSTTSGTWFYSTNNGLTWLTLGSLSTSNAKLLAADGQTRLYFKPNAGFKGSIVQAITFRAWDRTGGRNGGSVTTAANGGTTTFSSATDTASITVV
jgi:ELWxxDGT repeat protein